MASTKVKVWEHYWIHDTEHIEDGLYLTILGPHCDPYHTDAGIDFLLGFEEAVNLLGYDLVVERVANIPEHGEYVEPDELLEWEK